MPKTKKKRKFGEEKEMLLGLLSLRALKKSTTYSTLSSRKGMQCIDRYKIVDS